MPEFSLLFMDMHGNPLRRESLALDKEQDAVDKAFALDHAHHIEIWSGERRVATIKPGGPGEAV